MAGAWRGLQIRGSFIRQQFDSVSGAALFFFFFFGFAAAIIYLLLPTLFSLFFDFTFFFLFLFASSSASASSLVLRRYYQPSSSSFVCCCSTLFCVVCVRVFFRVKRGRRKTPVDFCDWSASRRSQLLFFFFLFFVLLWLQLLIRLVPLLSKGKNDDFPVFVSVSSGVQTPTLTSF